MADNDNIETMPLVEYAEKAYRNYSMYVILDRALPHITDGLKPVQRRILYAMHELAMHSDSKYKKSARAIGDVIGKFHPHGDAAAYEAMVLMAQKFSFRYPLVDGQGNWGSPDNPKSFAAMRYTECRLTDYARLLLNEISMGAVSWSDNFDGTMQEPGQLPAQVPNILLNGATGIAVGMATEIPPHNLGEVLRATVHLLDNPRCSLEDLCELLPAPDFPLGGEIISSRASMLELYRTGAGRVRQRATYTLEGNTVIIDSLPYRISSTRVLEQIAEQMQAKKLPMVADLRDESDHLNPVRLALQLRGKTGKDAEALMSHLFASTVLEVEHRINMNMIGRDSLPKVKGLMQILNEWLEFRTDSVKARLQCRLDQVLNRLEVLDGLMMVFLHLDEVIEVIRNADHPKSELMERLGLTEIQAQAVLEIRLRQLAKLEELRIRDEQAKLISERDWLQTTLGSGARIKTVIRREINAIIKEHDGSGRACAIVARTDAIKFDESAAQSSEPVTVVLSQQGWIRMAKGTDVDMEKLSYRSGDGYKLHVYGRMNHTVAVLDCSGRSYSLATAKLPTARGHGEPLSSLINAPSGVSFAGLSMADADERVVLASHAGHGFVSKVGSMHSKLKAGKQLIRVAAGIDALMPCPVPQCSSADQLLLAAASSDGRLLLFALDELPQLGSGRGNKIIGIKEGERLVAVAVVIQGERLRVLTQGRVRVMEEPEYATYTGKRSSRGRTLPKGWRNVVGFEQVANTTQKTS